MERQAEEEEKARLKAEEERLYLIKTGAIDLELEAKKRRSKNSQIFCFISGIWRTVSLAVHTLCYLTTFWTCFYELYDGFTQTKKECKSKLHNYNQPA